MSNSIQSYNAYVFSDTGRPQYGESATYEKEARTGRALRKRVKFTLAQWFLEPSFADNMARYTALRAALATPEGTLLIADENGTVLVNRRVHVADHALPEQWSAALTEVKVAFECWEEISANVFDATFTPTGGSAITLPQVQDWNEGIQADRYSKLIPHRRESWQTIRANGSIRANPNDTPAARLAALQAAAAALRACDKKEGVLAYGDFSQLMRVDAIEAAPGDGSDELKWSLTAGRLTFPAGNYAEAVFTVKQQDDLQANVRMTTVAGDIRAYDATGAAAKRDSIASAFTTGRALLTKHFDRKAVDGTDGAADAREWTFSFTYREILPGAVTGWTINIDDKTDFATGLITSSYSGRIAAVDAATALAKAADLGAGKYPMPVSSDLNVGSLSAGSGGAAEQFTEVTFSYVYQRRGTAKHAEVTLETSTQRFGVVTQTVSGMCAADTQAHALAFARTFIPAGLLIDQKEGAATAYHGTTPDALFQKQTFSYTIQTGQAAGTLDYGVSTSEDFEAYQTTIVLRGTARSVSKAASDTLINALVAGLSGTKMGDERTPAYKSDASVGIYTHTEFNIRVIAPLAADGNDILLAEFSVDRTYSNSDTVITPIPYAAGPHVQTNVGIRPGGMVISGSITTLSAGGGTTWARSTRSAASGGYSVQQREKTAVKYLPRSTSSIRCHTLEFTYAYAFPSLVMR